MAAKPQLRAVPDGAEPTASDLWLASYRREQEAMETVLAERAARQALKPLVMSAMNQWGMSDQMLARELGR